MTTTSSTLPREDRVLGPGRQRQHCPADGARLHQTIVGPRCPICGTAGGR